MGRNFQVQEFLTLVRLYSAGEITEDTFGDECCNRVPQLPVSILSTLYEMMAILDFQDYIVGPSILNDRLDMVVAAEELGWTPSEQWLNDNWSLLGDSYDDEIPPAILAWFNSHQ